MAKFDLSALTPEAADDDAAFSRSTARDNPAVKWLGDSWETDQARQVKVPANQARNVYSMLQNGARVLGLGVSVRIQWDGNNHTPSKDLWDMVKGLGGKHVTVLFRAKERTARPRKTQEQG